jgi:hypothetical protein
MIRTTHIVLALTAALTADPLVASRPAAALEYRDIAGKWCGEATDYTFTRDSLRVYWRSDRTSRTYRVTDYSYDNDEITVYWRKDGEEFHTVFGNFRDDRMVQKPSEAGPRRPVRRC